jgi:rhomboid protease GluP
MTYDDFEERVRDGKLPASAHIRFEPVTGEAFVPLRELELYQQLVHSDRGRLRRRLAKRGLPIVTAILVGIQVRIFLWSKAPGARNWLMEHATNWAPAVLEKGEVYRLVSYGFLHVDSAHLLFNMLFLAYTGANLERAFGRRHLILLYLVSVFTGGLLSMSLSPDQPSLGASGGDFGLIAASIVYGWKYADLVPPTARKYYGWALFPYLVFALWSGLRSEGVDNWGHIGGLLGGAMVVTLLHPELLERHRQHNRKIRRAIISLALLISAGLALAGQHLVPLQLWEHTGLDSSKPSYWAQGWSFTGDHAFFSPTRLSTLVVTTSTHPEPDSIDVVTDRFIAQVGAGNRQLEVLRRDKIRFQETDGREIELRFRLGTDWHHMRALILARGQMVHRIHLHTLEPWQSRYDPIWRRVLARTKLLTPQELVDAREKVKRNPRAWRAATDLAEALGQIGEVKEALRSYQRADALKPENYRPIAGQLSLMRRYGLDEALPTAQVALQRFPDEPRVIVAVAEILSDAGQSDRAITLLDQAWGQQPKNRALRQARQRLGLPTDAPATDPEAPRTELLVEPLP